MILMYAFCYTCCDFRMEKTAYDFFFKIGIHSMQGMEVQEKESQKDYSIQEICLERTYS